MSKRVCDICTDGWAGDPGEPCPVCHPNGEYPGIPSDAIVIATTGLEPGTPPWAASMAPPTESEDHDG